MCWHFVLYVALIDILRPIDAHNSIAFDVAIPVTTFLTQVDRAKGHRIDFSLADGQRHAAALPSSSFPPSAAHLLLSFSFTAAADAEQPSLGFFFFFFFSSFLGLSTFLPSHPFDTHEIFLTES